MKCVSSTKPWRLISSSMSSFQVAGPPWNGVSISGWRTCQISLQHSLDRRPKAPTGAWRRAPGGRRRCRSRRIAAPTTAAAESGWRAGSGTIIRSAGDHVSDGPDRRLGPVERTDSLAHLAAAGWPSYLIVIHPLAPGVHHVDPHAKATQPHKTRAAPVCSEVCFLCLAPWIAARNRAALAGFRLYPND